MPGALLDLIDLAAGKPSRAKPATSGAHPTKSMRLEIAAVMFVQLSTSWDASRSVDTPALMR
jgi:hypothetical protein